MPTVVLFALGLGMMLLEGALLAAFSIEGWTLSTPLALAIYLGLERGLTSGGPVLVGWLLPVEWMVAAVPGTYTLGLVVVFMVMCLFGKEVQSGWGVSRGVIAFLGGLLHGGVLALTLMVLRDVDGALVAAVGWKMWSASVLVAVVTIVMGKGFARVERVIDPRKGRRGLEL